MRRIGDQRPIGSEDRAGEIEPLLDIDRGRGGLEHEPHFLGDHHEEIVEDFEPHRIDRRAFRAARGPGRDALEYQRTLGCQLAFPA